MKIGYARVSTINQKNDVQIQELEKYGCDKIFCEKITGTDRSRPQLRECLNFMRDGEDELVVYKMSRLVRDMHHALDMVDLLKKRKLKLKVIAEPIIDIYSTQGKHFLYMRAMSDEIERDNISENTRRALRYAKENGRVSGRKPKLDESMLKIAESMLKDVENYPIIKEIPKSLGISVPTFYRYFNSKKIYDIRGF